VFWIMCIASQLQLSNKIFSGVLGRILQGSRFTTIIINLNPQGDHAKRRAMALLMFQRRTCGEFGRRNVQEHFMFLICVAGIIICILYSG